MGRTGIVGILVKDVEAGTARQEEKRETKSRVRKIKRKVHYKSLYDLYFLKIDIFILQIRDQKDPGWHKEHFCGIYCMLSNLFES